MIIIDTDNDVLRVSHANSAQVTYPFSSPEAFAVLSKAWLRVGWDTKYVYSFTWLGQPIIQLPEDMFRIQELIYTVKPDMIIETGIAHGGSLLFYASLCKAIGSGHVIGIDVEIRPGNRKALLAHELSEYITLIEMSSTDATISDVIADLVPPDQCAFVMLDSNHSRKHVREELRMYSKFVGDGSYIVAADGIMADLVGAPRSSDDWATNNPQEAVRDFLMENKDFELVEPEFRFNEGVVRDRVTYWPSAYLKRMGGRPRPPHGAIEARGSR